MRNGLKNFYKKLRSNFTNPYFLVFIIKEKYGTKRFNKNTNDYIG